MLTKLKNNNDMTFKEAKLPEKLYLVFDDDAEFEDFCVAPYAIIKETESGVLYYTGEVSRVCREGHEVYYP